MKKAIMTSSESYKKPFKECPSCNFEWNSRDSFLSDPNIYMIGYQTSFRELTEGLFFFNHSCKSTLAIPVNFFTALYNGPVFEKRKTGHEDCPEYCLHDDNLDSCPSECECAYVREIIQIIKKWPKS